MIKATVNVKADFGRVNDEIRRRSLQGLADAAREGERVAQVQAGNVTTFFTLHPTGTADGFHSGIKAKNRLVNVFDKGSLGKRTAPLKFPGRRKTTWPVQRKRANPYTAQRGDTTNEGVAPRNILTTARAAGRRALRSALTR